jgi:SagB-type dehydrogenase family enzyme
VEVLEQLTNWSTPAGFRTEHPEMGSTVEVSDLFKGLERLDLLERSDRAPKDWLWSEWMPEAAFFHFGTRAAEYPADVFIHEERLRRKAKTHPQPAPTKSLPGPHIALPPPSNFGSLGTALLDRRTWRSFSPDPVSLAQVANVLGLTWGVQRRGHVNEQGDIVFKTSPSGGARHPIEAYLIAQSVSGLAPAVYHYDAARHALTKSASPIDRDRFVSVLANQYYFRDCAAAVVMTACFERTMWRYPFTRAYRSVLIEAGHLAQTFALLATHMKLAPFQTIAFDDGLLEGLIGVNGERESAMYVVGIGNRNPGAIDQPGRILPKGV